MISLSLPKSTAFPLQAPAWAWSFIGAVGVWISVALVGTGSPAAPLMQALSLAPYLVLVGIGQMLVITLGPGNIDVSVAAVISLAAYVSVAVSAASGHGAVGVAAGIASGIAAAAVSAAAILLLRVPPIIATLSTSLIAASATLMLSDSSTAAANDALRLFVNARVFGVPLIAVLVAALTVLVAVALKRTVYGVSVLAIGQNRQAAAKAGLPVTATIAETYLLSGAFAGLAGSLLAAFVSPNTGLGSSYLLDSVAIVVIGGTLVAGGRAVPAGLWTGALFFVLLSGLMNLVGWSIGAQNILKGLLVVLVVVISGTATGSARTRTAQLFIRKKTTKELGAVHG